MPRHIHAAMAAAQVKPKLNVFHRSGMVTHFESLEAGIRRFVGVKMDADLNSPNHGKFLTTDLAEALPQRKEYLMAICEGHLAAMDESTARRAAAFGKTSNWQQFMATDEEMGLHNETSDAATKQDASNVLAAKVAHSPANPVPDPSRFMPKMTNASTASEQASPEPSFEEELAALHHKTPGA